MNPVKEFEGTRNDKNTVASQHLQHETNNLNFRFYSNDCMRLSTQNHLMKYFSVYLSVSNLSVGLN